MQRKTANVSPSRRYAGRRHERFLFKAIGYVENESNAPTAPELIRSTESRIVLDTALAEGMRGLETGGKIVVVLSSRSSSYDLLQHPRGDPTLPWRGVFSQHSPHRPNLIDVSIVDVLSLEECVLRVRGLGAINGTPVLDIHPAVQSSEA